MSDMLPTDVSMKQVHPLWSLLCNTKLERYKQMEGLKLNGTHQLNKDFKLLGKYMNTIRNKAEILFVETRLVYK